MGPIQVKLCGWFKLHEVAQVLLHLFSLVPKVLCCSSLTSKAFLERDGGADRLFLLKERAGGGVMVPETSRHTALSMSLCRPYTAALGCEQHALCLYFWPPPELRATGCFRGTKSKLGFCKRQRNF